MGDSFNFNLRSSILFNSHKKIRPLSTQNDLCDGQSKSSLYRAMIKIGTKTVKLFGMGGNRTVADGVLVMLSSYLVI